MKTAGSPRRSAGTLAFDVLLGASIVGWGVRGWLSGPGSAELSLATLVRLTIALLHLLVAGLVTFRRPASREADPAGLAMATPAVVISSAAMYLAPAPESWPAPVQALLIAGGCIAISAFLFLGRNFSILPGVRNIVARGPYRLVRHPAYAGELLMLLACCAAASSALSLVVFVAALALIALRIVAEERVLSTEPDYTAYLRTVRYRLVFGIW